MKKIIILLSLTALLMSSCGENFFELEPASKVTIDKIYKLQVIIMLLLLAVIQNCSLRWTFIRNAASIAVTIWK
nr:hypothetical protein [Segatella maculosa]